jgi:hypothetical protein
MKKNRIYIIFNVLVALMVFSACDTVQEPYVDYGSNPFDKFPNGRKILLEDFTAFRCGNCPEAQVIARDIANLSNGKVIVMAIHSGVLAVPYANKPYHYDFRTPEANTIDDFFGVEQIGHPSGMINRENFNGKQVLPPNAWSSSVISILSEPPTITIDMQTSYDSTTKTISGSAALTFLQASQTNYNICFYVLEDSIIQYQRDDALENPDILNYVHNHVFRGAINGIWGEPVSNSIVGIKQTIIKSFNYVIPDTKDWKPEHLKILAFVHDYNRTNKILQVEEKDLIGSK